MMLRIVLSSLAVLAGANQLFAQSSGERARELLLQMQEAQARQSQIDAERARELMLQLKATQAKGDLGREQAVAKLAERPPVPRGYSVVLVLGDLQNGPAPENLPEVARKALADMKAFLPYRSYRLLDAGWIASAPGTAGTIRLNGPDGSAYQLRLEISDQRPGNLLQVSLMLIAEATSSKVESANQTRRTEKALEFLETQIMAARQRFGPNHPDVRVLEAKANVARTELASQRRESLATGESPDKVMSTALTMAVGETVLVGTSRVNGDKALIVLLTAVK